MEIELDALEKASKIILHNYRERGIDRVVVNFDYYWNISNDQIYNPYQPPNDLTLGQLSFDLENINNIIEEDHIIGYALVWLSAIYRAVGNSIVG